MINCLNLQLERVAFLIRYPKQLDKKHPNALGDYQILEINIKKVQIRIPRLAHRKLV